MTLRYSTRTNKFLNSQLKSILLSLFPNSPVKSNIQFFTISVTVNNQTIIKHQFPSSSFEYDITYDRKLCDESVRLIFLQDDSTIWIISSQDKV